MARHSVRRMTKKEHNMYVRIARGIRKAKAKAARAAQPRRRWF
jgi:hypothetical protein